MANEDLTVTFGEPYHFIQVASQDTLTYFDETGAATTYVRLQPYYYNSTEKSIMRRKMYVEIQLMNNLTENMTITMQKLGTGDKVHSDTMVSGTSSKQMSMMFPVDCEVLLTLSTPSAGVKRGYVFFGYLNDEASAGYQEIQYVTHPIIFKATLDETRDTIISLS